MSEDRWKGVNVDNAQVAATIRRYGAPAHSKPHGPDVTILYYENPDFVAEGGKEFHDYAGEQRPNIRTRVTHQNGPGVETRTSVGGQTISAGKDGNVSIAHTNEYANPSELVEDVEVEGELDDEILAKEETNRAERDREAAPGGYRPNATAAPRASGERVEIPFLEDAKADKETEENEVEQADASTEPETKAKKGFSFSELDARDKEDLEKLYIEHVGPIEKLKGSGANGNVLKKDLIEALRTDR